MQCWIDFIFVANARWHRWRCDYNTGQVSDHWSNASPNYVLLLWYPNLRPWIQGQPCRQSSSFNSDKLSNHLCLLRETDRTTMWHLLHFNSSGKEEHRNSPSYHYRIPSTRSTNFLGLQHLSFSLFFLFFVWYPHLSTHLRKGSILDYSS